MDRIPAGSGRRCSCWPGRYSTSRFSRCCAGPAFRRRCRLLLIAAVVVLSQFKFSILWMVINFFDVLIIDSDTVSFLLSIFPDLRTMIIIGALMAVPGLVLIWRIDPFRVRALAWRSQARRCAPSSSPAWRWPCRRSPGSSFRASITSRPLSAPASPRATSLRPRAGSTSTPRPRTSSARRRTSRATCPASRRTSSWCSTRRASMPARCRASRCRPATRNHFRRSTARRARCWSKAPGGPTWYTEYNVLTGLSARSYGRLSYYVTRIAAGRVERGLPQALRRCGYKTISLYPAYGAFLSARKFQETAGIGRFFDSADMKAGDVEPDRFYLRPGVEDDRERAGRPAAVHLRLYGVQSLSLVEFARGRNSRRTGAISATSLRSTNISGARRSARATMPTFKQRLAANFPDEPFLVLRFGDHQPGMARIIDPTATEDTIAQRIMSYDPRYFTTYYAIDAVNFAPEGCVVGARPAGGALSSAGHPGGGGPAARSVVRGTEEDSANAATDCFSNAPAVPRPGASTGC